MRSRASGLPVTSSQYLFSSISSSTAAASIKLSRSTARWWIHLPCGLHPEGLLTTGSTGYILQARARGADVGVPRLEWDWDEGNEEVSRCGPLRGKNCGQIHDPDTKEEDRDKILCGDWEESNSYLPTDNALDALIQQAPQVLVGQELVAVTTRDIFALPEMGVHGLLVTVSMIVNFRRAQVN
ncbi:hypothetical protein F441_10339 [Phytophthora nicotianae CJ01A1]|uniref:Uncharacterized protein n=1 Tax=Phytophthora nicotianae CJ01A1 TaxID=1317063 RepID=W2WW69_PHYNI|nr:hypothetical protein F441_10339 [Phytophthora nicotianae CJ01A1]